MDLVTKNFVEAVDREDPFGEQDGGSELQQHRLRARGKLLSQSRLTIPKQSYKYSLAAMRKAFDGAEFYQSFPSAGVSLDPSILAQNLHARDGKFRDAKTLTGQELVFLDGQLIMFGDSPGMSLRRFQGDDGAIERLTALKQRMSQDDEDPFGIISESSLFQAYTLEVTDNCELTIIHMFSRPCGGRTNGKDQTNGTHGTHDNRQRTIQPYLYLWLREGVRCQIHARVQSYYQTDHQDDHDSKMNSNVDLAAPQWINSQTYHHQEPGSHLELSSVCHLDPADHITSVQHSWLDREASFKHLIVAGSTHLSRRSHRVILAGDGSRAELSGLMLSKYHSDQKLQVVHRGRDTYSHQHFKGIAYKQGQGSLDGRIHILSEAEGADACFLSRNLLLAPSARIVAIPELLCSCDQVKASHGATVSDLCQEELWYLRSRGLSQSQAYAMLLRGFMLDILLPWPHLADDSLCEALKADVCDGASDDSDGIEPLRE